MKRVVTHRRRTDPFSFFEDFEKEMMNMWPEQYRGSAWSDFSPAYEVSDKGEHYMMSFDLPGLNKDEINIEVRNGNLHVSGERKSENQKGDYSEKVYGRFERILSLPEGVSEEDLQARYEDGVLLVAVPKAVEKEKSKKIEIQNGEKEGVWQRLLGGINKDKEGSSEAA